MIHVVAVGDGVDPERLDALAAALARTFGMSCHVRDGKLDAAFARDAARGQYHSTAILERMGGLGPQEANARLLGVTAVDLFVPSLLLFSARRSSKAPARWCPGITYAKNATAFRRMSESCASGCTKRRCMNWATVRVAALP